MPDFFNNMELFNVLLKYKKQLIIITAVSCLLSIVFSCPFFIQPKFKSTAIIYPKNIESFSSESESEQLLEILQSEDIKSNIISQFNLYQHYKIDSSTKYHRTKVIEEFNKNIVIKKSEYESINISVFDTDKVLAVKITKAIIFQGNRIMLNLYKKKKTETIMMLNQRLGVTKHRIDSIAKQLDSLRIKYQILDYNIQAKQYTKAYLKAISTNKSKETLVKMSNFIENLQLKGGDYMLLGGYLNSATASYNDILKSYEKTLTERDKKISFINIISTPKPADKKSYPIRWLIVLLSTASALLLSVLLYAIIHNISLSEKKQTT